MGLHPRFVPEEPDERRTVAANLVEFLRGAVKEGQEAEVAINPELRAVLVFIDGNVALACSFDDLLHGPVGSLN